ncbi:MAG: fibronectin type III domain-containing protein, partial [Bacteroidales bacterium]|nr:fibronectin type III domain-containing protein [Bacteroidales bacterium]
MKNFTTLITLTFLLTLFSQIGWGQEIPNDWTGDSGIDIYKESSNPHGGTYCARIDVNTGTQANCDFNNTTNISVTAGNSYTVKFWYKTSAHVKGRIVLLWDNGTAYGGYTNAGESNWTEFSESGTVPSGATSLTIGIRFYDQSNFSAPETQYIDDLTFESPTGTSKTVTNGDLENWPVSNDNDSQVSVSSTLTEPATISSLVNSSNGVQVFDFTLTDAGSGDGVATIIDQLQITQGSANGVANWTNAIAGAVLNGPDITNLAGTVNATDITFSGSGFINISDNSNETYTLSIWLNTDLSAISDNDILEFATDYSNITTDASGSSFGSGAPESGDNNVAIDVDATELRFAQQPTDANINDCMSPDVSVEATDANGNRDLNFTETIRITSAGTLTSSPVDVAAVNGLATFSGANCIEHSATGTNLTLNAERASTADWNVTSSQFDITDINACGLEEFNGGTTAPAGWTFNGLGGTYTSSGNYGNSSPSLKMDDTGDFIETANVTSPSQLSFWIKGQTTDALSALLVEGWDGSWNTIENITNLPTTGTIKTYTTGLSSYTKFRFSYTKSAGNLAFDDVDVTCGSCAEPTNDATALNFTSKTSTSIDLSWTNGNGGNRIIICREGAAVSFTPSDNNTYTANPDYSAGTEVGTAGEGNKVIYNGSASTTTVTGLTPGTTYYFEIYEYGCSGGAEDYLTSGTPAEGNETTLPENVSNFSLTCITNTTATLTWTIPAGGFDGILVVARESTLAPSDPSCDGVWLTSPSTDFSTATTYCSNTTDSRYVYNSTGSTVTITGLTPGADYVFKAFTYNGSDWTSGTQTATIAEVKNVTGENIAPANQQISVMWNNPATCYDEILVIAHKGGSITAGAGPADGNDGSGYVADASEPFSGTDLGTNDFVVYKGAQTDFDATGLENGTQYCFKIFVRKGTEWSSGVEICQTPADVTVFNPGELIIIGFDSNVGGGRDSIFLTSLVDIKPGTEFLYVNSRYEAGAPANVRTAEWHGGGDDPDADPGIFKISYSSTAASSISAGAVISFSTNGYKADYIKVNGTLNADFSSSNIVGSANIHATDGDQIWLLQGNFTDQGTYYTLDGNVLWGLTNNIDWVPVDQPVSDASDGTGRESRLNPDLECFNLSMPTGKGYALYLNSSDHNNSKRNLLLAIMNGGNWNDGVGDATMNFNADFTSPYEVDSIGKPFTVTVSGSTDGTWLGGASAYVNDWFSCMNCEGLTVPDSTVDVTIPNTTDKPIIDHTAGKAAKFSYIAECNNITIDNNFL